MILLYGCIIIIIILRLLINKYRFVLWFLFRIRLFRFGFDSGVCVCACVRSRRGFGSVNDCACFHVDSLLLREMHAHSRTHDSTVYFSKQFCFNVLIKFLTLFFLLLFFSLTLSLLLFIFCSACGAYSLTGATTTITNNGDKNILLLLVCRHNSELHSCI